MYISEFRQLANNCSRAKGCWQLWSWSRNHARVAAIFDLREVTYPENLLKNEREENAQRYAFDNEQLPYSPRSAVLTNHSWPDSNPRDKRKNKGTAKNGEGNNKDVEKEQDTSAKPWEEGSSNLLNPSVGGLTPN